MAGMEDQLKPCKSLKKIKCAENSQKSSIHARCSKNLKISCLSNSADPDQTASKEAV